MCIKPCVISVESGILNVRTLNILLFTLFEFHPTSFSCLQFSHSFILYTSPYFIKSFSLVFFLFNVYIVELETCIDRFKACYYHYYNNTQGNCSRGDFHYHTLSILFSSCCVHCKTATVRLQQLFFLFP